MAVNLTGLSDKVITFVADSDTKKGDLVKITGTGSVGTCLEDEVFCGICENVRGEICSVKIAGDMTVPYSGENIVHGYLTLTSDGNGGVKYSANGKKVLVTGINATDKEISFIYTEV